MKGPGARYTVHTTPAGKRNDTICFNMRTTQRCKLCPVSPRGDVSAMKALDVVIMIIVSPGSCSTQHLGTPRQPPRQPPSRDPSGGRAAQVKTGTGGGGDLNNVTTRSFVKRSNIKQHREYLASRLDTRYIYQWQLRS